MSGGILHWDEVPPRSRRLADIAGAWIDLGAESIDIGLNRIVIDAGKRSTPAHVHGAEEEIFFVLAGSGLLWQDGATCAVGPGDTIVHLANRETHTLRASPAGLDVLAFGTRVPIELCYLPRAEHAWAGPTVVAAPGLQNLYKVDDAAGPFEFPPPGPRFPNVVALDQLSDSRPREGRIRLDPGREAGSRRTGLKWISVEPGRLNCPPHCHTAEEELFVVLEGDGTLLLDGAEHPVGAGSVIARPPGTGVAHAFRAGEDGLVLLAYGTRDPTDVCYYPRSDKVYWRGIGVIGRIEQLDYWDGEEL